MSARRYGEWDAAIRIIENEPRSADAPHAKACVADTSDAWAAVPRKWGFLDANDFCVHATLDASRGGVEISRLVSTYV